MRLTARMLWCFSFFHGTVYSYSLLLLDSMWSSRGCHGPGSPFFYFSRCSDKLQIGRVSKRIRILLGLALDPFRSNMFESCFGICLSFDTRYFELATVVKKGKRTFSK